MEEFDEQYYLEQYPDVKAAVVRKQFASGLDHYRIYGRQEGRRPRRDLSITPGRSISLQNKRIDITAEIKDDYCLIKLKDSTEAIAFFCWRDSVIDQIAVHHLNSQLEHRIPIPHHVTMIFII